MTTTLSVLGQAISDENNWATIKTTDDLSR